MFHSHCELLFVGKIFFSVHKISNISKTGAANEKENTYIFVKYIQVNDDLPKCVKTNRKKIKIIDK